MRCAWRASDVAEEGPRPSVDLPVPMKHGINASGPRLRRTVLLKGSFVDGVGKRMSQTIGSRGHEDAHLEYGGRTRCRRRQVPG